MLLERSIGLEGLIVLGLPPADVYPSLKNWEISTFFLPFGYLALNITTLKFSNLHWETPGKVSRIRLIWWWWQALIKSHYCALLLIHWTVIMNLKCSCCDANISFDSNNVCSLIIRSFRRSQEMTCCNNAKEFRLFIR